jgi:hypothetical protein
MVTLSIIMGAIQCTNRPVEPPDTSASIYITRAYSLYLVDDRQVWIVEYTINGVWQSPAFISQEAMTRYVEYLDTIGTVYHREEATSGG